MVGWKNDEGLTLNSSKLPYVYSLKCNDKLCSEYNRKLHSQSRTRKWTMAAPKTTPQTGILLSCYTVYVHKELSRPIGPLLLPRLRQLRMRGHAVELLWIILKAKAEEVFRSVQSLGDLLRQPHKGSKPHKGLVDWNRKEQEGAKC